MLITIALMVLAELAGGVAQTLHHSRDRHVGLLPAFLRTGQSDFRHAGADRHVATDERRAPSGAALLAIVVGERKAFPRQPIDIRRLIAHHAAVVVADVPGADVVAPDDEDVGFIVRRLRGCRQNSGAYRGGPCKELSLHAYPFFFVATLTRVNPPAVR